MASEFYIRDDEDRFDFRRSPPQVVTWFKVYAAGLGLLYLVVAVGSLAFFFAPPDPEMPESFQFVFGAVMLLMCLGLAILCFIPFFPQPKPWVWTYDLVLICLGMTGCTFVFCVPLLIYWLKPETKRYFGKRE